MHRIARVLPVCLASVALAIGGGAALSSAAEGQGSASIAGSVKFNGTPPAPGKIKMDADMQCKLHHKEPVEKQDVLVGANGELQNVFVYVKEGISGTYPAPAEPAKLDQQGCMYAPHVQGVRVGQQVQIVNSDQTLHNVNCKPTKSQAFNLAQPKPMTSTKSFGAPEVMVKCVCNVHPWMAAYIGVLDHPFFGVSGADGTFAISGMPAGTYTVEAWHEKFGTQTQQVTVADGEAKSVSFEFAAAAPAQ
jgi:hypothetical protein